MKVHLPVQYPEVIDHKIPWLRTDANGLRSQKYLYTPTQAGKQSRTDLFHTNVQVQQLTKDHGPDYRKG